MKKIKWILLGTVLSLFIVLSCEKDDTSDTTKAVFSYIADGFKVNFTNFSTNATSYEWDFGDESEGSTMANPLHVFPKKGQFLVTLNAMNQDVTSTFTDTVLIIGPNIKIDGDFTDWAYVEYTHENEAGTGGTLLAIKTFASAGYLNFYLEGTSDFNLAVIDLYLDSDNNPETGLKSWMYPAGSGADFLCEGSVAYGWGDVYAHVGPGNDWSWNPVFTFGDVINFSEFNNNDGNKAIEFAIKRDGLGTLNKLVNFAIVESDGGWSQIGSIPVNQAGDSQFIQFPL